MEGAGVTAVCMGTETVAGVQGTGIVIAFEVLFSSSTAEMILVGVVNDMLLLVSVFCNMSLCFLFRSSRMFVALDFDESVEEMGEKGFRTMGDSSSRELTAPKECFFTGRPAMSRPLLPKMSQERLEKTCVSSRNNFATETILQPESQLKGSIEYVLQLSPPLTI